MKWEDITNYKGQYAVSNCGKIMSFCVYPEGRMLTPLLDRTGRLYVRLGGKGKQKHFYVHRLVAFAFLGNPEEEQTQVNHKDGNPTNNHIDNLEWCTPKENIKHSREVLGNHPEGENHPSSKWWEITHPDGEVEIRKCLADFCREKGLHQGSLANVANGRHHTHKGYKVKKMNNLERETEET
jgi:hypothetical protein